MFTFSRSHSRFFLKTPECCSKRRLFKWTKRPPYVLKKARDSASGGPGTNPALRNSYKERLTFVVRT